MIIHWILINYIPSLLANDLRYTICSPPLLAKGIGSLGGSGKGRKSLASKDLLMWLKIPTGFCGPCLVLLQVSMRSNKGRYGSIYVGFLLCMNGGCVLTWKSIASKLRQVNQGIKKWRWCKFIHVLTLSTLDQYKTISKLLNTTCSAYI